MRAVLGARGLKSLSTKKENNGKCGAVRSVKANPAMRFEVLLHYQMPAFERFAEDHLHGIVL